jgi:hypothetical protein
MTHDPFRLIFKRSQSGSRGKPTFSLQVSAEMTPEFERAAQDYGLWKEVIYADPKLEESRELLKAKNLEKDKKRGRLLGSFVNALDGPAALIFLPIYLVFKLYKFVILMPFKIGWWLFKAFRTQDKQIMRFEELKTGKTITTKSLPEIVEAEEIIQRRTDEITNHVQAALSYSSEAFDATAHA